MLSLSIAAAALSDLTNVGQNGSANQAADGFLALLNAGSGGDLFSGGAELTNNDGNTNDQPPANPSSSPVNTPASFFSTGNSQNAAPLPPPPQETAASSTDNNSNNQTQNASNPSPVQPPSASSSDAGDQNANSSAAGEQTTTVTGGQTSGNTTPASGRLRAQIRNQLGDISQILLSMIQALSATPAQQVQSAAATGTGQTAAVSPNSQEISLLQNMQSLLQQMQQALAGQGQNNQGGQDSLETLSGSLLSDMNQFSQLVNQSQSGGNNTSANTLGALLNTPQFQDLGSLLKTSIAQVKGQLQTLQASNNTIFAQALAGLQTAAGENAGQGKTTLADNVASGNSSQTGNGNAAQVTTGNIPAVPVAQDITGKLADNALPFAAPVVQANVSQDGGNSAGSSNQDSSQNQSAQPVVTASQPSAPSSAGGTSFTRILNQVSQSDVLDQVQFQVKTALSDGSSKITIQLNPPDLGKVDVKLDIGADGKTSGVTITAGNQDTLNLLQRDTQGLTRALNDAGLATDSGSLNFSLSGGQQNQTQAGTQQAATTYQQAQPEEDDPVAAMNVISRSYVINLAEGLDITI